MRRLLAEVDDRLLINLSPEMKTSFTGLVKLLAKSLYPEPDVFIREMIQNAHDSIKLRQIRIDVNGNGPINTISAPWHRSAWGSEKEYEDALRDFVNKRYPDSALLVIPINLEYPEAKGVLYISDQCIPAISTSGVVDIYQERMSIRPNDSELMPDWAKFIRGIVDSPAVSPTAARDNHPMESKRL